VAGLPTEPLHLLTTHSPAVSAGFPYTVHIRLSTVGRAHPTRS